MSAQPSAAWRKKLGSWVEGPLIGRFIIALIVLNAVILGLETSPTVMAAAGPSLLWPTTSSLRCLCSKLRSSGWRLAVSFFEAVGTGLIS